MYFEYPSRYGRDGKALSIEISLFRICLEGAVVREVPKESLLPGFV